LDYFGGKIFGLKTFFVNKFGGFNRRFGILLNNRIEKQDLFWFFHEDLSREVEEFGCRL
jgi:hypothetical protein